MQDIDQLLSKARAHAEEYGRLYGLKETADDYLKTTYALLYEDATGSTVGERDACIKRTADYIAAVDRKRDIYIEFKTMETKMKLVFAQVEVWRSKQATNRTMDRVHA